MKNQSDQNLNFPAGKWQVARIENRFIFHAQYKLSPREQKLILYLIANMDPQKQKRFHEQRISVRELERMLKSDGKKWGGLYQELRDLTKRIRSKGIEFDTNLVVDGHQFPGYINWFQSVMPMKNEDGEVCISFLFSEALKPYLIDLNQYARINYVETAPLRSGFAIRMFQVLKAHRGKMQAREKISELGYEINELKRLLGVPDKYPDFRNFRRRVLELIQKEINQHTTVNLMEIKYRRNSKRQISHITFIFTDKREEVAVLKSFVPSEEDLEKLSRAQLNGYQLLVDFGVEPGIAYRQLLPKVTSSEFKGFEDWYFEEILKIFKSKGKGGVGAFVKWGLELKIFEQGDHFARIMEIIQAKKKRLETSNLEAWDNRLKARDMTAKEFETWYKSA